MGSTSAPFSLHSPSLRQQQHAVRRLAQRHGAERPRPLDALRCTLYKLIQSTAPCLHSHGHSNHPHHALVNDMYRSVKTTRYDVTAINTGGEAADWIDVAAGRRGVGEWSSLQWGTGCTGWVALAEGRWPSKQLQVLPCLPFTQDSTLTLVPRCSLPLCPSGTPHVRPTHALCCQWHQTQARCGRLHGSSVEQQQQQRQWWRRQDEPQCCRVPT